MADAITLKRTMGGFVPANSYDENLMMKYQPGDIVRAKISKPRNVKHSNKFHALLQKVFPHQNMWPTYDLFRKAIQRAVGYFEEVNGQVFDVSIAFDSMDQKEFEEFYDRVVMLVCERIIPGLDKADLEREVDEILKGRAGEKE